MVPNGWNEKPLKDICSKTISYGIVQTGENLEGGVPCVRVVDLSKNNLSPQEMIKTSKEIHQSYKKTVLCEGELMMALRGEIGLVKKVTPELVGANITRGLARLAPKSDIDSDYLLWTLRSSRIKNELARKSGGSALQEIALTSLRKVELPIPPLPEQRKIAKILSTWDKSISTTEKLIETSKQQKKALMQQLLTGKKRLVNPETGKAFEGKWEQKLFKHILKLDRGSSPRPIVNFMTNANDGVNWIKIGDTKKGELYINSTKEKITPEGAKKSRKVSKGEVIVSNSMSYGQPYILNIDGYIHDGWFVIRNYEEHFEKSFLLQILGSELTQRQYKRLAAGGVVSNISSDLVYAVKALLPPLIEQQKIASVLMTADKEIEVLEAKLAHFKQEKKALMQQLLTGKRRVKVDEMEVA